MTALQYQTAINAAQLHGFHFLASVLLIWYRADHPEDFPASKSGRLADGL